MTGNPIADFLSEAGFELDGDEPSKGLAAWMEVHAESAAVAVVEAETLFASGSDPDAMTKAYVDAVVSVSSLIGAHNALHQLRSGFSVPADTPDERLEQVGIMLERLFPLRFGMAGERLWDRLQALTAPLAATQRDQAVRGGEHFADLGDARWWGGRHG